MILIVIILTLFFFTSSPIYAQDYINYQNNPVIKKSNGSTGIYQPFVSKNGSLFSVWFADGINGKAAISTMKSINGIDWYDKKTLQVSSRPYVNDPFMFENNNKYQLYYGSSSIGPISIWRSESDDNITFTEGKEILKPEQTWERNSISCPSILQDQSIQYLVYAGAGSNGWGIGMAISPDGETWQKCAYNPIIQEGSQSHIIKYNNAFYIYYQSPTGLHIYQAAFLDGCNTKWTYKQPVPIPFGNPSPIILDNNLWFYGNFETAQGSAIGLASTNLISQPSYPIILIPGMFASWNADALLHNNAVAYNEWKLNPNVSEYDSIIQTLKSKGRILNKDLFVFPYDWRKSIVETTHNLNLFIDNSIWKSNPYQPVQLIGHSLGGVVSRIYAEQYASRPIKQIITSGSPLLGAVQAYKPLMGGEIDRENTLMWMAEKFVLLLNKSGLQSDRDTTSEKLPILFDLLPTFSFLKDEEGYNIERLFVNDLYYQYPITSSPTIPQFYLGAEGSDTLAGYILGPRSSSDMLLYETYEDGSPLSSWTEKGDGSILSKSSLNKLTPAPIQNHGELIYSKQSIKTILSQLNISVQDSDIPVGKGTTIFPAILTFIQSPASMQMIHNGTSTSETEKMIHLQGVSNGMYTLQVTGQSTGEYTVSIWLIGSTIDKWFQFKKQTALGKIDEYRISFDENTGGTTLEYIAPTPTPTTKPTPIPTSQPSPTSTTSSQSTQTSQSTQSTQTSQTPQVNTNPTQSTLPTPHTLISNSYTLHSTSYPPHPNPPQVLGITAKSNTKKPFPLSELLLIRQLLWGICALFLGIIYAIKRIAKDK